jgi:glycosyltransferase XagB
MTAPPPLRFCIVGAAGLVVNLGVYSALVSYAAVSPHAAAAAAFVVAAAHNYVGNRAWTFRTRRGPFVAQGLRFLVVSLIALAVNLAVLSVLLGAAIGSVLAECVSVLVAASVSFLGNSFWSFPRLEAGREPIEAHPALAQRGERYSESRMSTSRGGSGVQTSRQEASVEVARRTADLAPTASPRRRRRPSMRPRLGRILREMGAATEDDILVALDEQARTGGRLGELLVARGAIESRDLTGALARQLGMATVDDRDRPIALLAPDEARRWRAVALEPGRDSHAVAVSDPGVEAMEPVRRRLGRSITVKLADDATLDALLGNLYGRSDVAGATHELRERRPELSAYRTRLSRTQASVAAAIAVLTLVGLVLDAMLTVRIWTAAAITFYVLSVGARVYLAHRGWKSSARSSPATPRWFCVTLCPVRSRPRCSTDGPDAPSLERRERDVDAFTRPQQDHTDIVVTFRRDPGGDPDGVGFLDERELPTYTLLIPLYREKPGTVHALFQALARIDYPQHKLDGLLLLEVDDDETQDAVDSADRPAWLRVLRIPAGAPKTKPRALTYGLRYARGALVTIYDAEDAPDPDQLKQAVRSFADGDPSLACLQAKLAYYNPRQNLLTRWFTLEYDAWFNVLLPGLHWVGAPIPLGGTSNHFRTDSLRECLGWDPYNVTEDADLGVRLARLGLTTAMLGSTTREEAISNVPGWLRQRSRWTKGYMQTVLVHTRRPLRLYRDLGLMGVLAFLLTVGATIATALISPLFWALTLQWVAAQPAWIADAFPAPIYYPALVMLVFGNFLLVLLTLWGAVGRGNDDLAPHALLMPLYWLLNSIAAYMALVELLLRPHHWHKTEHGLHLGQPREPGMTPSVRTRSDAAADASK